MAVYLAWSEQPWPHDLPAEEWYEHLVVGPHLLAVHTRSDAAAVTDRLSGLAGESALLVAPLGGPPACQGLSAAVSAWLQTHTAGSVGG